MSRPTIASLPLRQVIAAYQRLTGDLQAVTKADAVTRLASMIGNGQIKMADITNTPSTYASMPPAPINATVGAPQPAFPVQAKPAAPDTARLAAIQAAADRAEAAATGLGSQVAALHQQVTAVAATLASDLASITKVEEDAQQTRAQVQTIASEIKTLKRASRIDPSEVAEEIKAAAAAAIAPILAAAQASPQAAQEIAAQVAQPVSRQEAVDLFGIDARDHRGNPLMFDTWGHPECLPVDPAFIWTEDALRHLYLMQETGRNVWLGGPAGTGKTQTIQQFAARTGRLFRRFVFDRLATREDYLGATGLANGSTVFQAGPVLDAYTTPGAICLLDEVGMANPAALSSLNGFLEPNARMAYADRVWTRSPGVLFAAADNSLTQGDQSGRFAGVQQMNSAFAERFAFVVPFRYLDPALEIQALRQHTGCSDTLARHVIEAITICRSKVDSGEIIDPPSIRQAIAFVLACRVLPVDQAWQVTIAARQAAESSVGLAAVYSAAVSPSLIEQEI